LLYVALTAARVQVAKVEEARVSGSVLAGDAVTPPRLSEVEDV
jgi:hypothetical protein